MSRTLAAITCAASAIAASPAHADDSLAPVHASALIDAPVAEVWHAWTTNEGIQSFLVEGSDIDLRPGGTYEIYFSMDAPEGSRGSEDCIVLSYLPEKMLSFEWNAPPQFQHARFKHTWVVIEFDAVSKDHTRIDLTHMGFAENAAAFPDHIDEWKEVRAYFESAWPSVISALQSKLAEPDTEEHARALQVASRLVGGEWTQQLDAPDGSTFMGRAIVEFAPDNKSLVSTGWLGSEQGMFHHASALMWIDPTSQQLKLMSITETGAIMHGHVTAPDDDTFIEHIELIAPDGSLQGEFTAKIVFVSDNHHTLELKQNDRPMLPLIHYHRVDKAPVQFRTLIDGTIID